MELMSRTKEEAISEMSQLLNRSGKIKDVNYFQQQILEREKLESTSIGFGVAVPHCRSIDVKETTVVTGVVRHSFKWDRKDKDPVDIIFLTVTPQDDPEKHLEALKVVAQTASCPNFREEISKILASGNIQLELKNRFDS
jgi:mannitol/fructose-specific phosphotransferase system IIA component (Ntr-type)